MKTAERHQLKTNEVAEQVKRAYDWGSGHGSTLAWAVGGLLALVLVVAGIAGWRSRSVDQAGAALAEARTTAEAPVTPPPEPGTPPGPAQAGSYPTEQARSEAAIKQYLAVVAAYPSTVAGKTARFEAAVLLNSLGRAKEAEEQFREVSRDAGVYGRMARLALAELQVSAGSYDEAIATYRDLASRKDGELPVDALLVQLARVYELAGKKAEAIQTFERVVTEFPDSVYVADARRAAEGLKVRAAS